MEAALVLVRLLAFAAGVTLFGTPLFVLHSGAAEGGAPDPFRPLLRLAGLVTAFAAAAALVVQTGQMAGDPTAGFDPATLRDVITGSSFGVTTLVRLGAGLAALALAIAASPGRILWVGSALLGALALGALPWSGHGAADEGTARLVHTLADIAHLLAAGVWLGALFAFVRLLSARRPDATAVACLHGALKNFSGVGSLAVAVILATGLVNSWFLVGPQHVAELASSSWGRLLLAKLGLFVAMLGFAGLNRYRLTPGLEVVLSGDPRSALAALRRSVALESALGGAVLGLVAVLGVLQPPAAA